MILNNKKEIIRNKTFSFYFISFFFVLIFINFSLAFNFECLNVSSSNIFENTTFNVIYNSNLENTNLNFFIKPYFSDNYEEYNFYNNYEYDSNNIKLPVNYFYYIEDSIYNSTNYCIHKESYKENDSILDHLIKIINYDIYNISSGGYYKNNVINSLGIINFLDLYEWTRNSTYLDIAIQLEDKIENDSYIDIDGENYFFKQYYAVGFHTEMDRGWFTRSDNQAFLINAYVKLYKNTNNLTYKEKAINVGNSFNQECNFSNNDFQCTDGISQEFLLDAYYNLYLYSENQTHFNYFRNLTESLYNNMNMDQFNYSFYIADIICNRFNFDCFNSNNNTILNNLDNQEPNSFFEIYQKISYYNDKYKFTNDINDLVNSFKIFQYYNFSRYYDFFFEPAFSDEYGLVQNIISMALMKIYNNYDSSNIIYDYKIKGNIEYDKNVTLSFKTFFSNNITVEYYNLDDPTTISMALNTVQDNNYNEYVIDSEDLSVGIIVVNITDNFLNKTNTEYSNRFTYGIKRDELSTIIQNYNDTSFVVSSTCDGFSNYESCKIEDNKGYSLKYLSRMQNYFSNDYIVNMNLLYQSYVDSYNSYDTCDYNRGDYFCENLNVYDYRNYYSTNKVERFTGLNLGLLEYYTLTNNRSHLEQIYRYINSNFIDDCNLKNNFLCNVSYEDNVKIANLYYDMYDSLANKYYLNLSNMGYYQMKSENSSWNLSANLARLALNLNKELDNIFIYDLNESYNQQIEYCDNNPCDFSYYYNSIDFLYNYYLQNNDLTKLKMTSTYFLGSSNLNFDCNPIQDKYSCYDMSENYLTYKAIESANYIDYIFGNLTIDINLSYDQDLNKNYTEIVNITCEYLNSGASSGLDTIVYFKSGEISTDSIINVYKENSSEMTEISTTSYLIDIFNSSDTVNLTFEINLSKPGENLFECKCENFSDNLSLNVQNFTEKINYTIYDEYFIYNENKSFIEEEFYITLKNPFYFDLENITINLTSKYNFSDIEVENISSEDNLFEYDYDLNTRQLNFSRLKSGVDINVTYKVYKDDMYEKDDILIFNISEKYESFTNFSSKVNTYDESYLYFNKSLEEIFYLNKSNNTFTFFNNINFTIYNLTFYLRNDTNGLGIYQIDNSSILDNNVYEFYNNSIFNITNSSTNLYNDLYVHGNATYTYESPTNIYLNISGDLEYNLTKKRHLNYSFYNLGLRLNYTLDNSSKNNWLLKINITNQSNSLNIYDGYLNNEIDITEPIVNNDIFKNLSNVSLILDLLRDFDYENKSKINYNSTLIILNSTNNNTIYTLISNLSSGSDQHQYYNDTILLDYNYYTNYYSNTILKLYKNISGSFQEICNKELLVNGNGNILCNNDSLSQNYKIEFIQNKYNVTLNKNISYFVYNLTSYNKNNFVYRNDTNSTINLTFEILDDQVIKVNNNTLFFNYTSQNLSDILIYFDNNISNNCSFINQTYVNNCSFNESVSKYKNGLDITFVFYNNTYYNLSDVFINLNNTYNITPNVTINNLSVNYSYLFKDYVKSNITLHGINITTQEKKSRYFNYTYNNLNYYYMVYDVLAYENFTVNLEGLVDDVKDNLTINVTYFLGNNDNYNFHKTSDFMFDSFFYIINNDIISMNEISQNTKYKNEKYEVNFTIDNLVNNDLNNSNITFDIISDSYDCNNFSNIDLLAHDSLNFSCNFTSNTNVIIDINFTNNLYNKTKVFNFVLLDKDNSDTQSSDTSSEQTSSGGSSGGIGSDLINNSDEQVKENDTIIDINKSYNNSILTNNIKSILNKNIIINQSQLEEDLEEVVFTLEDDVDQLLKKTVEDTMFAVFASLFGLVSVLGLFEFFKSTNTIVLQYSIESIEKLVYNSIEQLYVKYTQNPDVFFKKYNSIIKRIDKIEKNSMKIDLEIVESSRYKLLRKELIKAEDFLRYFNYRNELRLSYKNNYNKLIEKLRLREDTIGNYKMNINEKKYLLKQAKEEYIQELRHEKIFFKTRVKDYLNKLVNNVDNKTLKYFFKKEYNKLDKISLKNIEKYIYEATKTYKIVK